MRNLKNSAGVLCVGFVTMLVAGRVFAGTVVGAFDWDDGTVQDWTSNQGWVNLSHSTGSGSGYLDIGLDATSAFPPEGWFALATAPASGLFTGTWTSDNWVQFDFWAQDVAPEYVQVRWGSTNSTVWRSTVYDSDVSTMQTQTWTRLTSARFDSFTDWDYGGGTQEQFVNDLASIDWIGVYIWRNSSAAQNYGLDNFSLMVPEPPEIIMVFSSLATLGLSLRRRRR